MKQSEVNLLCSEASASFRRMGWALPPEPQWAATDFGLGNYRAAGLVEVLRGAHCVTERDALLHAECFLSIRG